MRRNQPATVKPHPEVEPAARKSGRRPHGLVPVSREGSDGAPLHNMLDLFAESSDEGEDEKDSRKACELRRVGGPGGGLAREKPPPKHFLVPIHVFRRLSIDCRAGQVPAAGRDAFEAREVRSMKRCPACGVERAHPAPMFRDDTGRSTKNCKGAPRSSRRTPTPPKLMVKDPRRRPRPIRPPGPAWEHRSVQKRKRRRAELRAAPPMT